MASAASPTGLSYTFLLVCKIDPYRSWSEIAAPMARRTKEEAEKTREAVLDAAIGVFLERGVARATLEEVARAAGVTRGAVYFHFQDKLDLFLAIDSRARLPCEECAARLSGYRGAGPLANLARALAEALLELEADAERRRLLTVVLLRCEYTAEMEPALKRQRQAAETLRIALRQVFERAASAGELVPAWQPDTAAYALHALLVGLIQEWLGGPEPQLSTIGIAVVRSFIASVGGRADSVPC